MPAPKRSLSNADDVRQAYIEAKNLGDTDAEKSLNDHLGALTRTANDPTGGSWANAFAGMGKSVYDNARGLAQAGVGLAKLATLPTSIASDALGTQNPITNAIGGEYDKLKAD